MPQDTVLGQVEGFGSRLKNIVVFFVFPVVIGTNTFNTFYSGQTTNTENIEYNNVAAKKRIQHSKDEVLLMTEIMFLKHDIKDLKKELKNCEDKKKNLTRN